MNEKSKKSPNLISGSVIFPILIGSIVASILPTLEIWSSMKLTGYETNITIHFGLSSQCLSVQGEEDRHCEYYFSSYSADDGTYKSLCDQANDNNWRKDNVFLDNTCGTLGQSIYVFSILAPVFGFLSCALLAADLYYKWECCEFILRLISFFIIFTTLSSTLTWILYLQKAGYLTAGANIPKSEVKIFSHSTGVFICATTSFLFVVAIRKFQLFTYDHRINQIQTLTGGEGYFSTSAPH